MKKISSDWTYFNKRVFPSIWLGGVGGFWLISLIIGFAKPIPLGGRAMFFFVPPVMLTFGYAFFKNLLFDLADEVHDDGDALVVKNGKHEERVPLTDIININHLAMSNPERVTLELRKETQWGTTIAFSPVYRWFKFTTHPTVKDLVQRVDEARRG